METVRISLSIPKEAAPYLTDEQPQQVFSRNAMMLYPLIRNLTISHGRAAEILGVHKMDLIEFYNSMGIPYLDLSREELLEDIASLERVLEKQS